MTLVSATGSPVLLFAILEQETVGGTEDREEWACQDLELGHPALRRDCLDHLLIAGEHHLYRVIRVWREFDGGHYAALVAQKGETLFVVIALTNAQRTENALLAATPSVIQKMLR